MIKTLKRKLILLRNYSIYKKLDFLAKINKGKFRTDPDANFVVSIASYPARSHLLPAVFERLNKQTVVPKKWILVLSEEEWPELKLPAFLEKLINRGIEVIWTKNNTYAVKKLVPVIEKYPELAIITLDDDIIYDENILFNLVNHPKAKDNNIVGHVGKTLHRKGNKLNMMFRENKPTTITTNPDQVFLIGWGGIYYPPNSLSTEVVNINAIKEIVPGRGSDIWFWAAAISVNTNQYAIEPFANRKLGIPIVLIEKTKPKDKPGKNTMEDRFQKTIDFFEIREKLLATLPNKS